YRTIKHHHNVHTLMGCESYMDPTNSALHDACGTMGAVVEENLNVFKVETALNSNTFPSILGHLQKPEEAWGLGDRAIFRTNRTLLDVAPFQLRWLIFQKLRAPYGLLDIAAGATAPVHDRILNSLFRQQAVPVKGQADVMIFGVPYLGPYNVNSYLNPVLIHSLGVGYVFNLYRGKPLVRRGGVVIFLHPLEERWNSTHHPSYIDFYNKVLPQTRDPWEIEKGFEEEFAHDERYIDLYRNSYAYHGVHPFYMWYWACYGQDYVGKVIVAGAKDRRVADRLGYDTAPNLQEALEMAKDTVGSSPEITMYHFPPIFLCDVD
ncbi:MAG: transcriptional regulator, partial [Dehalococcoidia bacterium]